MDQKNHQLLNDVIMPQDIDTCCQQAVNENPRLCKEDVTMPQDIEKRFQHLVNEWFSFQKRAGFSGAEKEILVSNLAQRSENVNKPNIDKEVPTTPGSCDCQTPEPDGVRNSWNDLCKMLSDADLSPKSQKLQEQGGTEPSLLDKEEQFKLTEKRLLEEKEKLADAKDSLLKYEEELFKREKLVQQQEQDKGVIECKLKATETGKAVLSKFYAALKDVLSQLEHRAQVLQDAQVVSHNQPDQHTLVPNRAFVEINEHFLSYELESLITSNEATEFENLSLWAAGFDADNWCVIVSAICQRFLSFLARETHLQEWALVLKKEAAKLVKMEQDVMEAKESSGALKKNLDIDKLNLVKERERLLALETELQNRKKAVAESERAAAVSLAELQKRAAELVVEESLTQEKRQQLDVLEKQLKKTLHDMQTETESLTKQKANVQERELQVLAKEKAVEMQLIHVQEETDKLKEEWSRLKEEQALNANEKDMAKEWQERLTAKEMLLKNIEKELESKCHAVESLARKLNAREKLLKNIQRQSEEERLQINEIHAKIDSEKRVLEETKAGIEVSQRNVEEAFENLAKERADEAEYTRSAKERMKAWENRLKQEEEVLLQKQEYLEGLEVEVKSEQKRCHELHSQVQKEQERMAQDLTEQERNLRKRESLVEREEEEVKKSLQRLIEKRSLVDLKLKQLKEIETRTESLEAELHKRHQEHLEKVERHAREYQAQVEHLDTIKHDLQQKSADIERRFQEVRAVKKEVKLWQKEAEKDFSVKMEELLKERADLEYKKQNLRNLQHEIERAGAKVTDHIMNLDEGSTKLDTLREKLDATQQKMHLVANHISQQQKVLKEGERILKTKEQELEALQKEWERKHTQLVSKEEKLNLKEKAFISREDTLNKESEQRSKLLKEQQQHSDLGVKIHYMITEEKLELRESMEVPQKPHQRHSQNLHTDIEAKMDEKNGISEEHGRVEQQAETLNLEMLQQEFARIIKERETLKAQQQELEETKNEVQDAKLTLAAQLRATKEMVVDASITAQKASREREALEQERRLLGKTQKEMKAALSAREAKLYLEERKLEKERQLLEDEREGAMGIIYKAEQMRQIVNGVETNEIAAAAAANHLEQAGSASRTAVGRTLANPFNNHDISLHHGSTMAVPNQSPRFDLDMINLWREKECAKIEREERLIMDVISRLHSQHQDDIKKSGLRELSNDLEMTGGPNNDSYHLFQRDLGPGLEALQMPRQGAFDVHTQDLFQPPVSGEPSDGFFSGSEAAFSRDTASRQQNEDTVDRVQGNYDPFFEEVAPSQTRLENVMQSLVNARQASRSRLQRTKNLLQGLPPSGGVVSSEVQQALCVLTDRLNLMEQMEDELADELREAYGLDNPDSEGIIVDKVELLCKMEEQQTLRAEWEEDMQAQLEKISLLQANSQALSCFSTPIKRTVFDRIVSPPSTNQSTR